MKQKSNKGLEGPFNDTADQIWEAMGFQDVKTEIMGYTHSVTGGLGKKSKDEMGSTSQQSCNTNQQWCSTNQQWCQTRYPGGFGCVSPEPELV